MRKSLCNAVLAVLMVLLFSGNVFGWSCETHKFIALKADPEMRNPEFVCCPDTCRDENNDALEPFHFYNAAPGTRVTPSYIDENVEWVVIKLYPYLTESDPVEIMVPHSLGRHIDYILSIEPERHQYLPASKPIEIIIPNQSGALYWEIVELYKGMKEKKEKGETVYYSDIAHFVGDLSNPLHNFPYGEGPVSDGKPYEDEGKWNDEVHGKFDSFLERRQDSTGAEVKGFYLSEDEKELLGKKTRRIHIGSIDDLKREISRIAGSSIRLAEKCYKNYKPCIDDGVMTREEAIGQIAESISLLRAIKESIDRIPTNGGE